MKDTIYLTLTARRVTGMTHQKPSLKPDEIAVRLTVSVDGKALERAMPSAVLELLPEHLLTPEVQISPETISSSEQNKAEDVA